MTTDMWIILGALVVGLMAFVVAVRWEERERERKRDDDEPV